LAEARVLIGTSRSIDGDEGEAIRPQMSDIPLLRTPEACTYIIRVADIYTVRRDTAAVLRYVRHSHAAGGNAAIRQEPRFDAQTICCLASASHHR
jgi:hypothetical protein